MKRAILTAGIIATTVLGAPAAMAGISHDGWDYSVDAVGDSNDGLVYDIRAIAVKETPESVYVSISANFPLEGVRNERADDAEIGWGDLFFDFSNSTFNEANANNSLYAVKFAEGTDSGVAATGVYRDVSAKSVGIENDGFRTLEEYYDAGLERPNTLGSDFVDKESTYRYYSGQNTDRDIPILNVVDSGTRLGDVRVVSEAEALTEGVDFAALNAEGDVSITLAFDRDLMPTGSYVASIFIECANDGVAILGNLPEVVDRPDPNVGPSAGTGPSSGGTGRAIAGSSAMSVLDSSSMVKDPTDTVDTEDPTDTVDTKDPTDTVDTKDPTDTVDTKDPIDTVVDTAEETEQNAQSVPEPSSLLGLGLFGFFGLRASRRVRQR